MKAQHWYTILVDALATLGPLAVVLANSGVPFLLKAGLALGSAVSMAAMLRAMWLMPPGGPGTGTVLPPAMLLCLLCIGCAASAPTVSDGQKVLSNDQKILACEAVGRDAGTYAAYYACTVEAGLR
jgi:hypothetical protein